MSSAFVTAPDARHKQSGSIRRLWGQVGLFLATAVLVLAVDLKVGTLNCYLLFDPAIDHVGKVDDENRLQPAEYQTKLSNFSTLMTGYEILALQETGAPKSPRLRPRQSWTGSGRAAKTPPPARRSASSIACRVGRSRPTAGSRPWGCCCWC
jgi:hypothetical protein